MESKGIARMLMGIEISVSAVLLALTSSGAGTIAILIGLIGLFVCAYGMTMVTRS